MPEIDPREILVVLAIAGAVLLVGEIKMAGKKFIHKTKCDVMRIVGKRCDTTPPAEGKH